MVDKKNIENEIDEETESIDDLKGMIQTLNELPTETLRQLLENMNEVEEYNKTHPDD